MDAIVFQEVHKRYGVVRALEGASFRVPRGCVAGLVGPNGSGKTTSLKLTLGVLKPNSGKVLVYGVEPWKNEDVRSQIGFLPEKPLYPPSVNVGALLTLVARLRGYGVDEARRAAKLVGIDQYWNRSIGSLSRGYLQRLGLAQAVIGEPDLLLLDEPTANLDPLARLQILDLIRVLREDLGATIVVSTHILPELERVVDRIIVIVRGRVIEEGPLGELASRYRVPVKIHVSTSSMSEVASRLAGLEPVLSVAKKREGLEVLVDSTRLLEVETVLSELRSQRLVDEWKVTGSLLEQLYKSIVGGGSREAL